MLPWLLDAIYLLVLVVLSPAIAYAAWRPSDAEPVKAQ